MHQLEAWAAGPINGKQRAVKVFLLMDEEPDETAVNRALGEAAALWRRWFVMGKDVEKLDPKTKAPTEFLMPTDTGHKVVER